MPKTHKKTWSPFANFPKFPNWPIHLKPWVAKQTFSRFLLFVNCSLTHIQRPTIQVYFANPHYSLSLCGSCHVPEWLPMGLSGPLESRRVSASLCRLTETIGKLLVPFVLRRNKTKSSIHLISGQACFQLIISHDKKTYYADQSVAATFHYAPKELKSRLLSSGWCLMMTESLVLQCFNVPFTHTE